MHELAHQWFGNLVTCSDWTHAWLNEGFATYTEALWAEYAYGFWYRWWFMHARSNFSTWTEPLVRARDNPDPWYYFAPMVYHKGAWVLHMLRRWLGDDLFLACLQAYLRDARLRYAAATTDDFIHVCEQTTGQDLGWFFDQWLYRTVHPQLRIDWGNEPAAGGTGIVVRVTIDQTQPADPVHGNAPFRIPIELRLIGPEYDERVTLLMEERHQEFVVPVPVGLSRVVVDPDRWLLHRVERLTAAGSPPVPARLFSPAPNPFNPRTVLSWETGEPSRDLLVIRDARGRTLLSRQWPERPAGRREFVWTGADDRGRRCASGVYFLEVLCAFPETGGGAASEQRLNGRVTLAR
jgi:aminopeptidase N